jgi:hypothetical protein
MRQSEKELAVAQIMHFFRNTYRDAWAPGSIFDGKNRMWIAVFNDLMKQGFIRRRKTFHGYEYKWVAKFPDGM